MSALSDEEDIELFKGFGAEEPNHRNQLRTKKRWSFNNPAARPDFSGLANDGTVQPPKRAPGRRMSDITGIDSIHKPIDPFSELGGAQLYSTESGRLFHAGQIIIILTGLPGRGKTHLSVSLTRYLRWLGVNTFPFHLGNYRRANAVDDVTHDLFVPSPKSAKVNELRQKMVNECLQDIENFFNNDGGQIAIYDAVNAKPEYRLELQKKFRAMGVQVLFIESLVTDDKIVMKNIHEAAKSSPDYENWDYDKAYKDYSDRINALGPFYENMGGPEEEHLSYIKFINFGERLELHNTNYGYLINKVVFYLMNGKIKSGSLFLARCYKNYLDYNQDPPLDADGLKYARNLTQTLVDHLKSSGRDYIDKSKDDSESQTLQVWTSVKQRTVETTQFLAKKNVNIRNRIQLSQKNPGLTSGLTYDEIREKFPLESVQYDHDPYHYRYPRAESYHDLAIKVEPLILEMERMSGDLLIIADETVLRVFYGYLMSCSSYEIATLDFKTDEIIEVKFNAYSNAATKIKIKDYDNTA
ncbi:putative 6-phosphofructo-2-kinase/fructose-2,6-bisphosphatase [Candida tropicalis]